MAGAFVHSSNPLGLLRLMWEQRELVRQLVRRDVLNRFQGTTLGPLWFLLVPLVMLAIYTMVFQHVFKARWPGLPALDQHYAAMLFVGLTLHGLLGEVLGRAPKLVVSNPNFVKKVVFPLELLSCVSLLSGLFHAGMSFAVLGVGLVLFVDGIPLTALWLPVILLPFALLLAGISWLLAALGVFLRDIEQFVSLLLTALMFLSPVFYPVAAAPEAMRPWLAYSPLTEIIEQSRAVLILGQQPDWASLLQYLAIALLAACLGYAFFQRVRRVFAEIL